MKKLETGHYESAWRPSIKFTDVYGAKLKGEIITYNYRTYELHAVVKIPYIHDNTTFHINMPSKNSLKKIYFKMLSGN